jgi:hypothetical protein
MDTTTSQARRAAGELPVLVVAALLLATGSDFMPPDTLVAAGPVELDLARVLILAGLASLVYAHGPRRELFASGLAIPLGLLVVAGLASTIAWGTEPRLRFLVESVALLYLTLAAVRARPEARDALAVVALVAVALAALPGVAQIAQDEATGFYRDGCTPVTRAPPEIPEGTVTRARGTFANPNLLAAHILLLAPLGAAGLAVMGGGWTLRRALAVALGLAALALALTYSRTGAVFALLAAGAGIWLSGVRYRAQLAAAVAVLAVAVFALVGSCGTEGAGGFGRTEGWRESISVAWDNPVYGAGLGRLGDVLNARDARFTSRHAHNLLLHWWAEAGPLALLAWAWLLAVLLWRGLRAGLAGDAVARGLVLALGAFVAYSMLDHPANVDRIATALFVTMGMAAALPRAPIRSRGAARD